MSKFLLFFGFLLVIVRAYAGSESEYPYLVSARDQKIALKYEVGRVYTSLVLTSPVLASAEREFFKTQANDFLSAVFQRSDFLVGRYKSIFVDSSRSEVRQMQFRAEEMDFLKFQEVGLTSLFNIARNLTQSKKPKPSDVTWLTETTKNLIALSEGRSPPYPNRHRGQAIYKSLPVNAKRIEIIVRLIRALAMDRLGGPNTGFLTQELAKIDTGIFLRPDQENIRFASALTENVEPGVYIFNSSHQYSLLDPLMVAEAARKMGIEEIFFLTNKATFKTSEGFNDQHFLFIEDPWMVQLNQRIAASSSKKIAVFIATEGMLPGVYARPAVAALSGAASYAQFAAHHLNRKVFTLTVASDVVDTYSTEVGSQGTPKITATVSNLVEVPILDKVERRAWEAQNRLETERAFASVQDHTQVVDLGNPQIVPGTQVPVHAKTHAKANDEIPTWNWQKLGGKKVIITGGSRGLGKSMALEVARRGADVILVARNQQELDKVALLVRELGRKVYTFKADLSDSQQYGDLYDRIESEVGPIDILVNNAGIQIDELGLEADLSPLAASEREAKINGLWEVNYKSVVALTEQAMRKMSARRKGQIINLGSASGQFGLWDLPQYAATKGAIHIYTEGIRKKAYPLGVQVMELVTGSINTDMIHSEIHAVRPPYAITLEPEDIAFKLADLVERDNLPPLLTLPRVFQPGFALKALAPCLVEKLQRLISK